MDKTKVLFVCLGNICRSPMAEGLFLHKVKERGLSDQIEVDSAGTSGWHKGASADHRMAQVAQTYGVHLPSRSRQLLLKDFKEFDFIVGMDATNMHDIQELVDNAPNIEAKAQVVKMRDFDPLGKGLDVPDPYYGGQRGFEEVYDMLDRSTEGFLDFLQKK